MKIRKRIKIKFNRKVLILTAAYFTAALLLLTLAFTAAIHPYLRQLAGVCSALCFIRFYIKLKKLLTREIRKELWFRTHQIFSSVKLKLDRVIQKVRRALGLPDRKTITGSEKDEKSYIFDADDETGGRKRRIFGRKNAVRFRDLESNADKIRFLYVRFVLRSIRGGFGFDLTKTPDEMLGERSGGDAELVSLYNAARYSGGRRPITDDEVARQIEYAKKYGKV